MKNIDANECVQSTHSIQISIPKNSMKAVGGSVALNIRVNINVFHSVCKSLYRNEYNMNVYAGAGCRHVTTLPIYVEQWKHPGDLDPSMYKRIDARSALSLFRLFLNFFKESRHHWYNTFTRVRVPLIFLLWVSGPEQGSQEVHCHKLVCQRETMV